jgi:flagellar protein FliO/FliZ
MRLGSVFIPDENGELVALQTGVDAVQQMPTGDYGTSIAKMFISLIVIVVVLYATLWFLRRLIQNRLEKGSSSSAIQILEKRMLSPKTMLYLVEIDNKKVLLAESQLEIKKITENQE